MRFAIKRFLQSVIVAIVLFSSFGGNVFSYEGNVTADIGNLAFKQEITIPIDTSLEEARFQPIDTRIMFDNSCWAQNETKHSVRVSYEDGSGITEIDSQIYDLEYSDNSHITACSLVFLIPEEANGKEKYYVLYDGSETSSPEYVDHLSFEDAHYFYEPISGQVIDFDYYKIFQDEYIIYGILQKGEILGNGVSNSIARLKPEQTEFETTNMDQLIPLYMSYSTDGESEWAGSAWATTVSKNVLIDGNLMIRFKIEGVSPEGVIKTDNIYTYYYCPTSVKRMDIDVYHEVLETTEITGDKQRDPSYAALATFKARSATIEKMNIGDILPSLHFYAEDGSIKEYSVPSDPNTEKAEWILSSTDDANVGDKAWICMDDPSTGKAHGLVFESNTGFLEGAEDGLQVKASTKQHVKLPGLEADAGDVFATRNSYEGGKHDTSLPKGMNVAFNMEVITFQTEGYEAVDKESEIYQKLVVERPITRGNESIEEEEETEKYSLTAYVHLAPSFPLGSMLSAVVGKNFSYVSAELYKDDSFASSGSIGRLALASMDLDFEGKNLIQTVKAVLGLFDWKNASLFKKISFPGLEAGSYLIKIYKENQLFGKERQYVGFTLVELEGDSSTHIYCRPEGKLQASIVDQESNGVENVRLSLLRDDVIIEGALSDKNGSVSLNAPCYPRIPYTLHIVYQGFLVKEKKIDLGFTHRLFTLKESFDMSLHQLELNVKDILGLPPAVDISPMLTSNEMIDQISISAEKIRDGNYRFTDLYPADYTLKMSYKSFVLEEAVDISNDKTLSLSFPAEFTVDLDFMNSYGMSIGDGEITLKRSGKGPGAEIESNGEVTVSVPPGEYELRVSADNEEIAKQKIDVKSDKSISIVTTQESSLHTIVTFIGILLAVCSIIFFLWKKNIHLSMDFLAIALIIIALVSPWWALSGDTGAISTTTKTLLFPSNIVTQTSSQSVLGGEISFAPPEFSMVLELLAVLLMVVCVIVVVCILIKDRFRKISKILSIVSIVLLVVTVLLFFVAMSQVTDMGVGSFSGRGDLDISIPGLQENAVVTCSWGPGIGFYFGILAIMSMFVLSSLKLVRKLVGKIQKTS